MKQRTFIQCMVLMAVLTLLMAVWPIRKPRPMESAHEPPSSAVVADSGKSFQERALGLRPVVSPPRLAFAPPAPRSEEPVKLAAAQVLATVNQTPIQLKDLVPLNPAEAETAMTPREYDSRLNRAIEMAAIFQAARAQAVELSPAQRLRLSQAAQVHQADLEHYKAHGLSWSSIGSAQTEFEQRVLAAQILEQNLVAAKAGVAPSPDPEIQSRYEQARRDLLDQLLSTANIAVHAP